MIYLIDKVIRYDTEMSSLSLISQDLTEVHSMTLTPISNRILHTLVQQPGMLLSRETLIEQVWEDSIHEGSVHTLTQYLSNIRKFFRDCLPDTEVIITEPRKGYYFSKALSVEILSAHNEGDKTRIRQNDSETWKEVTTFFFQKNVIGTVIFTGLFFIISVICSQYFMYLKSYPEQKIVYLTDFKDCPVYLFNPPLSKLRRELYIERLELMADKLNLQCAQKSVFYLSMSRGSEEGIPGNMLLARCTENRGRANSCFSYQYSRWQEKK